MKSLKFLTAALVVALPLTAAADITRPTQHRYVPVIDAAGESTTRLGFWVANTGVFVYGADLETGDVIQWADVQVTPEWVSPRSKADVATYMSTIGRDRLSFPVPGSRCAEPNRDPDAPNRCFADDGVANSLTTPGQRVRKEPRDNF